MKNSVKKVLSVLLLSVILIASVSAQAIYERSEKPYAGKTVILHTNDVHGALEGYAYLPVLREKFESQGATVIIADMGDFTNGNTYVSYSKGLDAVLLMNAAGYDVATFGNHEFDFGYDNIKSNIAQANFPMLCADVLDGDYYIGYPYIWAEENGTSIMMIGLETPVTQTKVNPVYVKDLTFLEGQAMFDKVQEIIDFGKKAGIADVVVILSHLGVDDEEIGNRSIDLYKNVKGIDFIMDGHAHVVMTEGPNKEPIQSTGTQFANIGVVVIDTLKGVIEDNYLIPCEGLEKDPKVEAMAKAVIDKVTTAYGAVFAKSEVELNGAKSGPGNRDSETNNGDLITDAMRWFVFKDGTTLKVPAEDVVTITNGGGIRAKIVPGDVSMNDVKTVLPFGNTIAVIYVTGDKLLEALEASTYMLPIGGFPQVSGIKFTLDTSKAFDQGDQYPDSTYFGPKSIQRVTINEINGKPFDPAKTYAVITNNFCAVGGDTYYAFAATTDQFDTGIPLDEALMAYITEVLGGVIGQEYAAPQGRITIL